VPPLVTSGGTSTATAPSAAKRPNSSGVWTIGF